MAALAGPAPGRTAHRFRQMLALVQGAYFAATGLWPILHIGSFMAVTGPKEDVWLVQTVGALVFVVGLTILFAVSRRDIDPHIVVLAAGTALALGIVDVVFHLQGILRSVYLLDAAAEALIVVAWAVIGTKREDAASGAPRAKARPEPPPRA